jgi:eukaryotic-like serine/threonine-protein kinase
VTPERLRQIEDLCHGALACRAEDRGRFLTTACGGDEELRHEVESLLALEASASGFMSVPAAAQAGSAVLDQARSALVGEFLERHDEPPRDVIATGEGYRVRDSWLDREAASKVTLPSRARAWVASRAHQPFFWIAAVVSPVCIALYIGAIVALIVYGDFEQSFGWTAAATRHSVVVATVASGGVADGKLHPGDVVAGVSTGVVPPVGYYRRTAPRGAPYFVYIASPRAAVVELTAPVIRTNRRTDWIAILLSGIVWGLVGLFTALIRPDVPVARLAGVVFVFNGFLQLESSSEAIANQLPSAAQLVFGILGLFFGLTNAIGYHTATRMPGPRPPRWTWPGLGIVIYVLGVSTLVVANVPSTVLWWTDPDRASRLLLTRPAWFAFGGPLQVFTELSGTLATVAMLVWKFAHVRQPDERRRLRWLFTGCIAANLPFALYKIFQTILVAVDPAAMRDSPLRVIANVTGTLVPIAVAYAIVKRQIPDVTVVVRRGLRYLLARNALAALLLLPLVGLAYTLVANRDRTVRDALFANPTYFVLLAGALASLRYRDTLRLKVDQRFFREAYDREKVLMTLLDRVDQLDSAKDAAGLVSQELDRGLHPEWVQVWFRIGEAGDFALAHSSSPDSGPPAVSVHPAVVDAFERQPKARMPRTSDGPSGVGVGAPDVELIVPIAGTDMGLVGLLLLGPKKSEEPYGSTDCDLLEAIAKQIAVVYENVRLKNEVGAERRNRHEVLDRLEARGVNLVKECPQCGRCYDSQVLHCSHDGQMLSVSMPVDRVIDGQYRLERLIGRGGMGAVYEAEDLRLGRSVAIKLLLGRFFGERDALRRFEREARLCARLNHPSVVTIFGYGTLPAAGAYLVMERLVGVTLRDELRRTGTLPPPIVADWFDRILAGVDAAHTGGIVHRDLKPENILIVGRADHVEQVKVLDFGLAKMRPGDRTVGDTVSVTGMVAGTFGYMPPEQLAGGEVDERADIFALGIMVAEALTGTRPFDRSTHVETLKAVQDGSLQLSAKLEHSPLASVLRRCLAAEPANRFGSVAALRTELIPALRAL